MRPATDLREETQEHIEQQRAPQLPADGLLAVPEKVAHLQGLLDLLEEDLDPPAGLVELTHAARRPFEVVGYEDHLDVLAVELDEHDHAAQLAGVPLAALRGLQSDDVVTQHPALGFSQQLLADVEAHVVLGSGHPEDAAPPKVPEVEKVDVGLVEEGYLIPAPPVPLRGCRCAAVYLAPLGSPSWSPAQSSLARVSS